MSPNSAHDTAEPSSYTFGHTPAFTSSHGSRTAANTAAYLVPNIKPASNILDVGCGPGTITCDFAAIATAGKVIGVDIGAEVIQKAQEAATARNLSNVTFQTGDAHKLPFEDNSFDIVHTNATLVHLPNPKSALSEMRRVCRVGGLVAVRECDMDTTLLYPETAALRRWKDLYITVAASEGADMNAGRKLCAWAGEVGFKRANIEVSASTLTYAQDVERRWWGELHAMRLQEQNSFRSKILSRGLYTEPELDDMIQALREWSVEENGLYSLIMVQILCRK